MSLPLGGGLGALGGLDLGRGVAGLGAVYGAAGALELGIGRLGRVGTRVVLDGEGQAGRECAEDHEHYPKHDEDVVCCEAGVWVLALRQEEEAVVERSERTTGVLLSPQDAGVRVGSGPQEEPEQDPDGESADEVLEVTHGKILSCLLSQSF